MKRISAIVTGLVLAILLAITSSFLLAYPGKKAIAPKTASPSIAKGFAVIELFTSEGCSSCPPADEFLAQLQAQDTAHRLFILAYHVDYWDRQGRRDRFSSSAYSKRQAEYANMLQLQSVYTPQLIVNGQEEFVGSDRQTIAGALASALKGKPVGSLSLSCTMDGKSLYVKPSTSIPQDARLVLALVQPSASSSVKAGENAGRALQHVQVVRSLAYAAPGGPAATALRLPADFEQHGWELIGFVQDRKTGAIEDAARVQL